MFFKQKIITYLTVLGLLLVGAFPVSAQTTATGTGNVFQTSPLLTQKAERRNEAITKAAEKKAEMQTQVIEMLRNKALREIDRRITGLNNLIGRINEIKKLDDAQKSAITAKIQTEVTNLTNLRTKIQSDSDLTTLRADTKSIVQTFRIYALFIPMIHILTASEKIINATDKLTVAHDELQNRITQAQLQGIDTTSMEASLSAMMTKINQAETEANKAESTVLALTPEGYPGNKTSLKSARQNLKNARQYIAEALSLGKRIAADLKKANFGLTQHSPTATSSTTIEQ